MGPPVTHTHNLFILIALRATAGHICTLRMHTHTRTHSHHTRISRDFKTRECNMENIVWAIWDAPGEFSQHIVSSFCGMQPWNLRLFPLFSSHQEMFLGLGCVYKFCWRNNNSWMHRWLVRETTPENLDDFWIFKKCVRIQEENTQLVRKKERKIQAERDYYSFSFVFLVNNWGEIPARCRLWRLPFVSVRSTREK